MISGCIDRSLSRRTALELGSASLAVLLATGRTAPVAAEDVSAPDRHKALVQRLFADGVNAGDERFVTSLCAPTLAGTNSTLAPIGMPISLHDFRLANPGAWASVDALVAEGDLVAARITWRGPHPPAGTHIAGHTMHLFRIEQEQIIEAWSAGWDWLEDDWVRKPCLPANPLMTS